MNCISLASRQAWQPINYPFNTQQWSKPLNFSRANTKEAVGLSVCIWLNIINSLLWWSWWMVVPSVLSLPHLPLSTCRHTSYMCLTSYTYPPFVKQNQQASFKQRFQYRPTYRESKWKIDSPKNLSPNVRNEISITRLAVLGILLVHTRHHTNIDNACDCEHSN